MSGLFSRLRDRWRQKIAGSCTGIYPRKTADWNDLQGASSI